MIENSLAFRNAHLSVSRLRLYKQCPLAFYFRYAGPKGPIEPRNDAATFGVVLHATLELVFAWVIAEEYIGPFPLDQAIEFYKQVWREATLTSVALYQEGLGMIRKYARSHDDINHFNILGVELEFNIIINGFKVNGFIDRVDKINDDTIAINDYKSNRSLYLKDELDEDLQMSVYGLAARELFPWAKRVRFVFQMLRFDVHQGTERTAQELDDAAGYIAALGHRTENTTEWKPTINANCAYCDYRSRCPAYKEALERGADITKIRNLDDLEGMLAERKRVHDFAKLAYDRQKAIDTLLKKKIAEEGEFEAGNWRCRTIPAYDTTYEPERVITAFVEAGFHPDEVSQKVLTVSNGALEALVESAEARVGFGKATILKATLKALATQVPGTPRIDVKPIVKPKKS